MLDEGKYKQFMQETFNSFDVEHVGHVYVLGSSLGYYKIGLTTNLYQRFSNFGVKLPFEVWLEDAKIYFDCGWAEKYWHLTFDHKRVNGEWFKLNEHDLDHFNSYPSDINADTKFNCLFNNTKGFFWESEGAVKILENFNLKIAYKKRAIQTYLDFSLSQPDIARQYYIRNIAKFNALREVANNPLTKSEG